MIQKQLEWFERPPFRPQKFETCPDWGANPIPCTLAFLFCFLNWRFERRWSPSVDSNFFVWRNAVLADRWLPDLSGIGKYWRLSAGHNGKLSSVGNCPRSNARIGITVSSGWNHNIQYHSIVIQAIPPGCQRALDVGCGRGTLARKLARHCVQVIGVDADDRCLSLAETAPGVEPNIAFVDGNVMSYPFQPDGFDFVVALATLHHLVLRDALSRFRLLLKPGGVLVIVGLYRAVTLVDYAFAAVAFPISRTLRTFCREAEVGAPLQDPAETLKEIRSACDSLLPGGVFHRLLFFRYSFVWRKPPEPSAGEPSLQAPPSTPASNRRILPS